MGIAYPVDAGANCCAPTWDGNTLAWDLQKEKRCQQ